MRILSRELVVQLQAQLAADECCVHWIERANGIFYITLHNEDSKKSEKENTRITCSIATMKKCLWHLRLMSVLCVNSRTDNLRGQMDDSDSLGGRIPDIFRQSEQRGSGGRAMKKERRTRI